MPLRVKMPSRRSGPTQHHSSAKTAKVELRRWLVEQLGGIAAVRVLDCFCAKGALWEKAYDKTSAYLGLDIRRFDDERRTIVGDSRRFLRHRDVHLSEWNLFDLDAFGSPLEHMAIICHRLRVPAGQRVGFVLTDGTGFNAKLNSINSGLLRYVGMVRHRGSKVQDRYRDDIFNAAVTKSLRAAGLRVLQTRAATKDDTRTEMRYVALLTESVAAA